jgi:signal transduction histidine kinase
MIATLLHKMKQVADRTSRLHHLNIGPRLALCFMLIILAMSAGSAVLIWQFQQAQTQAERLAGVDQELIAVLQAHISFMSFYERLDVLAQTENTTILVQQIEAIHNALLQETERARSTLSRLTPDVQLDPALMPTLSAIQLELPAQLQAMAMLAKSGDWKAVRLRLANQIGPLESTSAALVENVDREVAEQRAQAVTNIRQAQRRIFAIVLITAAITLLFAAILGLTVTRSITQPLGRLVDGTAALARGDFFHRVPASGNDEIAGLGSVFNDMIVKLQELYRELQASETYLAEAQKLSHTGSFGWNISNETIYWSAETFRIFEFEPTAKVTIDAILDRTHPEDRSTLQQVIERVSRDRIAFDVEQRLLMPDESVKYLRVIGHPFTDEENCHEFVGAVTDITGRKRAEEAVSKARSELAKVTRITSLGVLTASIAHEVSQPLSGIITNANTCLRMLSADPPNVDGASETAKRTIRDGNRASAVITRLRALFRRQEFALEPLDLNEATREVIALSLSDLQRNRVVLGSELAEDLPPVNGDRIQLQQVILNLLRNASDAMTAVEDRPRELLIRTERDDGGWVRLTVRDVGVGFTPETRDKLFEAFYTTKNDGMGIGLSVSRSIIEAHQGRLWAVPNDGPGATFSFSIPSGNDTKVQ